jgi:hypothetical protein
MPDSTFVTDPVVETDPDDATVVLLLPGHRSGYTANDFRDYYARRNDEAVVDYLVQCCLQKRVRDVEIVLQLPAATADPHAERETEQAYRDMLSHYARTATSRSLKIIPNTLTLTAIGIVVLIVSHYLSSGGGQEETMLSAASDFVRVGAWVVLWTAFSGFFFEGKQRGRRAMTLRRLAKRPIQFRYDATPDSAPLTTVRFGSVQDGAG